MIRFLLIPFIVLPLLMFGQKKENPVAGFSITGGTCVGDTIQFENEANTSNVRYDFDDGTDTREPNPKHIFLEPGTYVIVQTALLDGNSATSEVTIEILSAPTITLNYSQTAQNDTVSMLVGQNVTISLEEAYNEYQWFRFENDVWVEKASGDQSYTTNIAGSYRLWTASSEGCSNQAPFWIETRRIEDDDLFNIIMENNILTPNNDGINDVLVVKDLGDPNAYLNPLLLYIYNKAGVLVYQNENYANDWNGVDDGGAQLATGTYYFIAKSKDRRGKTGYVDIIRSE